MVAIQTRVSLAYIYYMLKKKYAVIFARLVFEPFVMVFGDADGAAVVMPFWRDHRTVEIYCSSTFMYVRTIR